MATENGSDTTSTTEVEGNTNASENNSSTASTEVVEAGTTTGVTFTAEQQAKVDDLVGKARIAGRGELTKVQEQLASLTTERDSLKSNLESVTNELDTLKSEKETLEESLNATKFETVQLKVAVEKKVPLDRVKTVSGKTEDELKQQIDAWGLSSTTSDDFWNTSKDYGSNPGSDSENSLLKTLLS